MHLRSCIQYDAMHLIAGNVKNTIFTMLGLLPAKPNAVVLQYDEQVNGRHRSLMRLSEFSKRAGGGLRNGMCITVHLEYNAM